MNTLRKLSRGIDALNSVLGRSVCWLLIPMIGIAAVTSISSSIRQFTGASGAPNWMWEIQWYLFSVLFLVGGAYTLAENEHVRVDILYDRLSARTQAWINIFGSLCLLLPFAIFMTWLTADSAITSTIAFEKGNENASLWRWPIKWFMPIGFGLLALQGISEAIKNFSRLAGLKAGDGKVAASPEGGET